MDLKGKAALITGGGTGVGLSIALALVADGCKVGLAGRRESALQEAVAHCRTELGPDAPAVVYHSADVSDRDDVKRLFDWAAEELGPIDILVNSAGINVKNRAVSQLSGEEFDKVMQVNCTGTFNTMWAVLPQMRERKDGLIVNLNSIAGLRASPMAGVGYSASKFAMTALGIGVANEEGDNGIRVTNVYPGEINTSILDQRPEPLSEERKASMLQAEDLGALVALIAKLPPRAHVAELVIKPTIQKYR